MNIGMGERRKIILLVDADPHARAILRNALEAAGFTVGEAANSFEGERTVSRVQPDAVLFDLMEEHDVGGISEAARLNGAGNHPPVYIVSTAAEALAERSVCVNLASRASFSSQWTSRSLCRRSRRG